MRIFFKSVFYDVDLWAERGGREARTVLLLLLLSDVSNSVKYNLQRCLGFAKSFDHVSVLFTWYDITLWFCHWCTCHWFVFFFFSLYDKRFYFQYCFCKFCCLRPRRLKKLKRKQDSLKKKRRRREMMKEKQWGLKWLKVLFVLRLPGQRAPTIIRLCCLRLPSLTITFQRIGSNKCFK